MKDVCFNSGEVVAISLAFVLLFAFLYIWIMNFQKQAFLRNQRNANALGMLSDAELALLNKGFVLVNCWKLSDIRNIANEMGVELLKHEAIRIVKLIKTQFTMEQGINRMVIQTAIRYYIANVKAGEDLSVP